ncbi:MAG: SPOR domain-containing protein [Pseudomonadota bacterium]
MESRADRWIARAALPWILWLGLSGCAGTPEDERVTWQCARTPDGRSWECAQQRVRGGVAAGSVAPAPRTPSPPKAGDAATGVETKAEAQASPAARATAPAGDLTPREAWTGRLPGLQESQPKVEASPVAVPQLVTGRGPPPEPEPALARWERGKKAPEAAPPAPATPPASAAPPAPAAAPPAPSAAPALAASADTAAPPAAFPADLDQARGPPGPQGPAAGRAPGADSAAGPEAATGNRPAAVPGEAASTADAGREPAARIPAGTPSGRAAAAAAAGDGEPAGSSRGPERRYTVQVGAFHTDAEARAYVEQHRLGEVPLELRRRTRGGREYSVLTFGSFATVREAQAAWRRIAAGRELDFWVRPAD